jgi:hypothetical protein
MNNADITAESIFIQEHCTRSHSVFLGLPSANVVYSFVLMSPDASRIFSPELSHSNSLIIQGFREACFLLILQQ